MITAQYVGGPMDGKQAPIRGGVSVGWELSVQGCVYRLEKCGARYVMRAVKAK